MMVTDAAFVAPSPAVGGIQVEVDPDLFDLVPVFLENRVKEIGELERALGAGDAETIREIGHRMKGIGGGYGFEYVSVAGKALEDMAKAGSLDGAGTWIAGLADYLRRVEPVEGPEEE